MSAKERTARGAPPLKGGDLRFGARNYAALGAALAAIVIGFILLHEGSITAAPILLVLGYCVLIPYGLITGRGKTGSGASGE
jgi:hypothetical protein